MTWTIEGNIEGPVGPEGPDGPIGPIGPDGPEGPQGIQGPDGPQGEIGPDGIQGEEGPMGPTGPEGPTGTRIMGYFGDVRTPAELPPDGLIPIDWDGPGRPAAAYQMLESEALYYQPIAGDADPEWGDLWVFTTQFGWMNVGKIAGPQGPPGPQGEQGIEGPQGEQGIQGQDGPQGPIGDDGPEGPIGPEGDTGERGSKWYTGAGSPGVIVGAIVGDFYLDNNSGNVWELQ